MFRGSSAAKVDDKGRLKIPSAFKALLDAASVTQLYVTSIDGKSAQIWPLPAWEKLEKQLVQQAYMNDAVQKYLNLTSFYGQQLEIDSQSRVVLPQKLRDKGKLDAEVVVLGKLNYLEVWNEKEFEIGPASTEMTVEDRKTVQGVLTNLMIG